MSKIRVNKIETLDGRGEGLISYPYEADIVIESHNTIVRDGDTEYKLSESTLLPYTTTGAGMPEGGAFVAVGDGVRRADSLSALQNISGRFDGDVAVLASGSGRDGTYRWDSSDMSPYVSADVLKSIFVPSVVEPTGTTGAWVRARGKESPVDLAFCGYSNGDTVDPSDIEDMASLADFLGKELVSNFDYTLAGTATLKSGYISNGKISIDCYSLPAFVFEEDVTEDRSDLLTSLLPDLQAGNSVLNAMPPEYEGYTFGLYSDDFLSNRYIGLSLAQVYRKGDVNVVGPNGLLHTPLEHSYTNPTELRLTKSKPASAKLKIDVTGDGTAYTEVDVVVDVKRSNFNIDVEIENKTDTYAPMAVGVNIANCANVTATGSVSGTDFQDFGYAWLMTRAYNTTLLNCESRRCRKAYDMTFAHNTHIKGGKFYGLPASHVAWGLTIEDTEIYQYSIEGDYQTQSALSINGRNIKILRNSVYAGDFINTRFIEFRDDTALRGGHLVVKDNKFISEAPNSFCRIVQIDCVNDVDFGTDINLFDYIEVSNNIVKSEVPTTALHMSSSNTHNATLWPKKIVCRNNTNTGSNKDLRGVNLSLDPSSMPAARTGGTIVVEDATAVFLSLPNWVEKYDVFINRCGSGESSDTLFKLTTNYVVKRVVIENSSVTYALFSTAADDPSGESQNSFISFNNCYIHQTTGIFNIAVFYGFSGCYFENEITITPSRVKLSTGNFGADQSFALDGVYGNFTLT